MRKKTKRRLVFAILALTCLALATTSWAGELGLVTGPLMFMEAVAE